MTANFTPIVYLPILSGQGTKAPDAAVQINAGFQSVIGAINADESAIAALSTSTASNTSAIATHTAAIASNTTAIAANTTAIGALEAQGQASPIPAPAVAAGFNTLTFGPNVTIGQNWFLNSFPALGSIPPPAGTVTQNPDGTVTLTGNNTGAIVTAQKVGSTFQGTTFGTGYYVEFVMKFTPTLGSPVLPFPECFGLDINFLLGNPMTWPGQASTFKRRAEIDFFQWPLASLHFWVGAALDDWFGTLQSGADLTGSAFSFTGTGGQYSCNSKTQFALDYISISGTPTPGQPGTISGYSNPTSYRILSTNGTTSGVLGDVNGNPITTVVGTAVGTTQSMRYAFANISQPNATIGDQLKMGQSATTNAFLFSNYNRYGFLVIPAAAADAPNGIIATQGTILQFLNGVQVNYATGAPVIVWDAYNAALAPPPVAGTSAGSLIDVVTTPFIIGTKSTCPMTIQSVSVWQNTSNNNVVQ